MMEYVAGFMFSEDRKSIALVRKQKPAWQAGKLNGIGGKIEEGEDAETAMIREFEEEAGVRWPYWRSLSVLKGEDWTVHFFYTFTDRIQHVQTMEEEEIEILDVSQILSEPSELMANLPVLITLALDESGITKPVSLFDNH